MWVFDGNKNVSPIHVNDELMCGCTYQYLMDMCIANATIGKGRKDNPNYSIKDGLVDTLKDYLNMVIEESLDELDLCMPKLVEEMERRMNNR